MELIKRVQFTKEQLIEAALEDIAAISDALQCYMPCAANKSLQKSLVLKEIALASLNAKPIGAFHIADQQVGATTDYIKDGEWPICNGVIEVYAAPPAPVVNEFIPKNLDRALDVVGVALPESKEEFNFQIERWIQRLIDRVIRYADEFKEQPMPVVPEEMPMPKASMMNPIDTVEAIAKARGWNACRAAMLKGGAK